MEDFYCSMNYTGSVTRPEALGYPKLNMHSARLSVVYCPGGGGGGGTDLHFCDAGAHVKPFSQDHK